MNCNNVKELLLSYLDNELSPLEIVSIEDHLSDCPGCRAELEALAETKGELRQAFETIAARVSPSPHAWENIKHRLAIEGHRRDSILSPVKSKMKGWIWTMKLPRPVWQTLGILSVAVLIVLSLTLPSSPMNSPVKADQLTKFSSYDDLKEFIKEGTQSYYYGSPTKGDGELSPQAIIDNSTAGDSRSGDYSTTNIQVQGVDEADIVKTDGEFIYLASDTRVIIAMAYPADEAQIIAEIDQDENIIGLFINGDKLVVIHQNYNNWVGAYYGNLRLFIPESAEIYTPQTYISVYDVSEKANPVLTREMSIDGNYFGSRMVGDYVYMVVNESAYERDNEIELPAIHLDGTDVKIEATDIYYSDIEDYYYSFTTIAAVNVKEDEQEPKHETLLLGATSNLYVSLNNIYVASAVWSAYSEKTAIHRIRTSDGDIEYEATGDVPGSLVNQFSMDEYQGFFRVATTTTGWGEVRTGVIAPDDFGGISEIAPENNSANHVYILDMDLNIIGKVEDLAPGEQIYSARFMGEKAYMVTFRQVDPLFVIDLANPRNPKVLGQLKITGYSDYLHPYDENHLIGIGKEATTTGLFQGVKISLFDVSDVSKPKEIDKYIIGERGTESPVLDDHKALLFDRSKNLMVLPVLVSEGSYYYTWQGAYVFDISIDGGLQLKGKITHSDDPSQMKSYYYGVDTIQRSLYIEDVLYTISEAKIGMNDLESLNELGEILLPLG